MTTLTPVSNITSVNVFGNEFVLAFQATLAGSNVGYKFHGWYYMDL